MTEIEVVKKKRGRKPKNYFNLTPKVEDNISIIDNTNSEDEKIIFHLPITINEINSYDNDNNLNTIQPLAKFYPLIYKITQIKF
jgi:hypothetical protein